MDCPQRRRAVATLIAGLFGVGVLVAQEPTIPPTGEKTPMVMPPRTSPQPVTVTVSPFAGSALPPTGVPVGTPVRPVPISGGTMVTSDSGFAGSMPTGGETIIQAAPSPYFGFYPTQWRSFPDQPYPASQPVSQPVYRVPGQPLPTYPTNIGTTDTPPPLLKHTPAVTTPNPLPLPMNVQATPKASPVPAEAVPAAPSMLRQTGTLPPLYPVDELKGPDLPVAVEEKPVIILLATMGRPRLTSSPEPVPETPALVAPAIAAPPIQLVPAPASPAPVSKPAAPTPTPIIQASAVEIPFSPAPANPGFAADSSRTLSRQVPQELPPHQPARVRHAVTPERQRTADDEAIKPVWPVIPASPPGK